MADLELMPTMRQVSASHIKAEKLTLMSIVNIITIIILSYSELRRKAYSLDGGGACVAVLASGSFVLQ